MRYKNWKMYFAMVSDATGGLHCRRAALSLDAGRQHQARSVRDLGRLATKTLIGHGRRTWLGLGTAYVYDWNMLPIGQALWLKELEILQGLPADAGPGKLQPRPGDRSRSRTRRPQRLTANLRPRFEKAGAPAGRPLEQLTRNEASRPDEVQKRPSTCAIRVQLEIAEDGCADGRTANDAICC